MNSQINLYLIRRYLAWFESEIYFENSSGSLDINTHAERFLIPILNPIFNANFQLLKYEKKHMSSVDLGDKKRGITIQITSEKGPEKVRDTIKKFVNKNHYKNYNSLYFVILRRETPKPKLEKKDIQQLIQGEKKENGINEILHLNFDINENYWTLTQLNDQIERRCTNLQFKTIVEHLESEYPKVRSLPAFDDILIPYQIAFKRQLDDSDKTLSYKFTNEFFGREKELANFKKFITSEDKLLAVVADGGFGKTRLCIEAFKNFIDPKDNIEAFSLNEGAYHCLDFVQNLSPEKSAIILIDDAHKRPDILDNLINAVNRLPNFKLVLTVRQAVYDQTIKRISTHHREITLIRLIRLEYEETQKVFKSVLPKLKDQEIKRLADKSRGVPGVILSMANLARKGKILDRLSEEESFVLFVNELKEQAIDDVYVRTYIDKEKINKTIQSISFFTPVTCSDDELKLISEINRIDFEETTQIISQLEDIDFIKNNGFISIVPDPYSDVILIEGSTRLKFLLEFPRIESLKDRLLTNLVSVDYSKKIKLDINGLLINFIKSVTSKNLDNDSDIKMLQRNLDTLSTFTYKKPRLAFLALENLFPIIVNSSLVWQKNPNIDNYYYKEFHDKIDLIFSIAFLNTEKVWELENAYKTLLKYIASRNSNNLLITAFRYKIYDFHEYGHYPIKPFNRQYFLLDKLERKVANEQFEDTSAKFVLTGLKLLLNLEFEVETYYDRFTSAITFGNAAVLKNSCTTEIRIRSIQLLIKTYYKARSTDTASSILDVLFKILYFVSKSRRLINNYEFDQSDEIDLVINFMHNLLTNSPSINERGQMLRKLKLVARKEFKEGYQQQLEELIELASAVNELKDRLNLLILDDHFYLRKNLNSEFRKIVEKYSTWGSLIDDLVDIGLQVDTKNAYQYNNLLNLLESEYPREALTTLEYIKINHPDQIIKFAFLIRVNYTNTSYFYQFIDYLWNQNSQETQCSVIWLLTYGRNQDFTFYKKKDFTYIKNVLAERNISAIRNLTFTIHKYILLDVDTTLELIGDMLKFPLYQHDHNDIIHSLFSDNSITKKFREELKEFVFKQTIFLSFENYELSDLLAFLDNEFGFNTLLNYLIKKIEHLKKTQGDFFHLYLSNTYTNLNKNEEERDHDFLAALEWFIKQDLKSSYENIKLLDFIKPVSQFSESLKKRINASIIGRPLDELIKTSIVVNVFEQKNIELVQTLIAICNEAIKDPDFTESSILEIFGSSIIYNQGIKFGSLGQPFQQDLEHKELLEKILKENELNTSVRTFLESALVKVDQDIEDSKNRGPHSLW